jgi:hypothetical protein
VYRDISPVALIDLPSGKGVMPVQLALIKPLFESSHERFQPRIMNARNLKRIGCLRDIFKARPVNARGSQDNLDQSVIGRLWHIGWSCTVNHKSKRLDSALGRLAINPAWVVGTGPHFPSPKRFKDRKNLIGSDAKSHAMALTANLQPKH